MVLKGCFYLGVTLCRLYESSIFGARAVFGLLCLSSGCTGPCLLDIGGVFDIVLTGACTGCWAGPPLFSVIVNNPVRGRVCSPFVGVEAPRSDSKLQCEVGRTRTLPLGKEPLCVPPQELFAVMCNSVTLPATWCAHPQRSLWLALPSGAASAAGVLGIGLEIRYG